jgi:hypothetical protein
MKGIVMIVKRVVAALSLIAISMLPASCRSANAGSSQAGEAAVTRRAPAPAEDRLEIESKRLAGPNAIDCGRVGIKGDPKAATQCAVAAQKAAKPFRVRYDLRGIDSSVAVAIVRTPIGTVGTLSYDSDPSGGSHVGEAVYPKKCPEPVHLWINPSGRINCFQKESSPPKDIMSPNAEPY